MLNMLFSMLIISVKFRMCSAQILTYCPFKMIPTILKRKIHTFVKLKLTSVWHEQSTEMIVEIVANLYIFLSVN